MIRPLLCPNRSCRSSKPTPAARNRLPNAIAKEYRLFLEDQLNYLKKLQDQVLETLLLRLKIAEQQNQVTCDDVSYFLVKESQRLGFPFTASLPHYQMAIEPVHLINTPRYCKTR
ncbi:MAG: hypothetical protein V4471_06950 [Pseudomonadota bacterium]